MDSFTIKALSSFPREEIRGRRRERWNSIFQSVVFVNSDGEAASVRRVALFGHFRHFGIETDQLSLSLSLSLSPLFLLPLFIHTLSFHSISFLLLIIFNLSPLLLYHSNSLPLVHIRIHRQAQFFRSTFITIFSSRNAQTRSTQARNAREVTSK